LAAALAQLLDVPWSLDIVGDGPARAEVEAALAPLGARVTYYGALDAAGVTAALAQADLFVWPAINEAFGMALLEAQASGLPVVAGASGGVGDIVVPGMTGLLAPPGDADAFAAAVRRLILDPAGATRRACWASRNRSSSRGSRKCAGGYGRAKPWPGCARGSAPRWRRPKRRESICARPAARARARCRHESGQCSRRSRNATA